MKDLVTLVNRLRSYSSEREWFEFKENWFEPAVIGEYISALSNSAACAGRKEGYFRNERYIRIGSSKENLRKIPEKGYIVRVGSNKTGYRKVQDQDE